MQRNWDTVRRILLKVEALPTAESQLDCDQVEGVASEVAAYHMRLMIEAGLARGGGRPEGVPGAPAWVYIERLTWQGHELLEAMRRDTVWNAIKRTARDKGVDLGVDAIRAIAKLVLAQMLGGGA